MLLPEAEAKFKYCPYLMTPDGKFRFCQVTMCMMWRWQTQNAPGLGYCGLAGRPEAQQARV